jgi:hypothetical protein
VQREIDLATCPAASTSDRLPTPDVVTGHGARPTGNVDLREQLVNDCLVGTFGAVQWPLERITQVHGILLDIDPGLLRPRNGLFEPGENPRDFFDRVRPVLDRHPLVSRAEVRISGTGLHAIIWLEPPVELRTAAEQQRWAGAVRAVQSTLPVDPRQPGITAVTRPVGSVNGKNGALVEQLREGRPVSGSEVEAYLGEVAKAPFSQVVAVLLGGDRVSPCPFCLKEGSRLDCLDWVGRCYRRCDKITRAQFFDLIYANPRGSTLEAVGVSPFSDVTHEAVQLATTSTQPGHERSSEDSLEAEGEHSKPLVAGTVAVQESQLQD